MDFLISAHLSFITQNQNMLDMHLNHACMCVCVSVKDEVNTALITCAHTILLNLIIVVGLLKAMQTKRVEHSVLWDMFSPDTVLYLTGQHFIAASLS